MFLLAIDQGNTRTKFGLFQQGALRHTWAVATEKAAGSDALHAAILHHPETPRDLHLALCTVVPEARPHWQQLARELDCPLTVITGQSPTPLVNAYETPETLGPDRLMAAVAAAHRAGAPVIAVSLGTATVVDAVSAKRAYLGGLIAPGIGLSAEALFAAASGLWPVEWHEPARAIGATSREAMSNGLFFHSLGGLREMIRQAREALAADAPVVLTGGWAPRVAPHLERVALVDEHLILHGIAVTLAACG